MVAAFPTEELTVFVVDPGETACHAGAKVDPGAAENNGEATGHVFAGVIAYAFHDGECSGVAHCETLACATCGKQRAAGSSVEGDIAEKSVGFALQRDATSSANHEFAAAEAFADEVVGEAFELEDHAVGVECSERLAGHAFQIERETRAGRPGIVGAILRDLLRPDARRECGLRW